MKWVCDATNHTTQANVFIPEFSNDVFRDISPLFTPFLFYHFFKYNYQLESNLSSSYFGRRNELTSASTDKQKNLCQVGFTEHVGGRIYGFGFTERASLGLLISF